MEQKMYKVIFMGNINGWCYEDKKVAIENGPFADKYQFEEVFTKPKFLTRYC